MKKVLVVIDMQNDFIDGALGTDEAVKIVGSVAEKIREYEGQTVFATRDTHEENYLETAEGRHLPVPHCIRGTKGWEIRPEIAGALAQADAQVIDKPTFGSEVLARKLQKMAEQEELSIELAGLCTDICVVSNALLIKAKLPETPLRVDPACCAGVTRESHEAALLTMKMCQVDVGI
ncbi:MAG: cysteine hydrolase [Lachnospiraceae bacterium]|jgi:nicotinamidase-related amidase|nr:cysteine hydrolase [Lachnospiraceae bacterium]